MSFEESLIHWYRQNRRHMPWREDPTPYHVYLSEIMLQQTQVDTVIAYYLRFLDHFPTIKDLSKASEDEVLKLWEGLGYYSRGRNLQKAAKIIELQFGGEVPSRKSDLLSLPGIGAYTSKAILSIAFHQKEIAVDGNLIRVYARLEEESEPSLEKMKSLCEAFFKEKLVKEDPSLFNQALMDLGELICLPRGIPLCEQCPLASFCKARKDKTPLAYPSAKKPKEKREENWTVFVLNFKEEIAIEKRQNKGLLASLYEFPLTEGTLSPSEAKNFLEKRGFAIQDIHSLGSTSHVFSHLLWHLKGYQVNLLVKPVTDDLIWGPKKDIVSHYSIPSTFAYFKKKILS